MKAPSLHDAIMAAVQTPDILGELQRRYAGNSEAKKLAEAERLALVEGAARIFDCPDGRRLLDALLDRTLRLPVMPVQLEIPPDHAAAYARMREGENGLVRWLLSLISAGRPNFELAPVQPQETNDVASRPVSRKPARRPKRPAG